MTCCEQAHVFIVVKPGMVNGTFRILVAFSENFFFQDKIYMYGGVEENGVVSNELWAFDVSAKIWENITVRTEQCNSTAANSTVLCGRYLQCIC
jgi:hypothetical protein